MTHARGQIRGAVAAILSRNPVAWGQVFKSRVDSKRQVWPYLKVYFASEDADPSTVTDPCIYDNRPVLTVEGMLLLPGTGDTQSIEDKMEAVDAEIKTKLTQSALRQLIPQVQSFAYFNATFDVVYEDFEGGVDHAEVITSWRIGYSTLEGFPATLL